MSKKKFKNKKKTPKAWKKPPWLNIYAAKNEDETVMEIYGDIGESWWEESIDARGFAKQLKDIKTDTIIVKVNSLGGSVFDGIAIHNQLKSHSAKIIMIVEGVAASIASVIVMAADEIRMPSNSMMMIHDPWTCACGSSDEMRQAAEALDKIKDSIVISYERSGLSRNDIADLMSRETWFTAEDALEQGFCDTVVDSSDGVSNQQKSTYFNYYNRVPRGLVMAKKKKKKINNKSTKPLKAFRAEVKRQAEVKAACKQYGITGPDAQALIDDRSMTGKVLKAEAMAASPHSGPISPQDTGGVWTYGDHTDGEKFNNAMSHGIMVAAGIHPKNSKGKPIKMAPGSEDFVNMSGVELCRVALARDGVNISGLSRARIANAALGTGDFVETLEQTANTILATGYADKPAKHRAITAYRPASDYRQLRELRVESEWDLEKILENGKIARKVVNESVEGYAVDDYGGKFVVTRQVLVNDGLGAVMASLNTVGRRVNLLEDRDVFGYIGSGPKLKDGSDLFSVGNKTLAGTAGALSETTLSKGRELLANQQDMNKHPVGAEDSFLLTGTGDRTAAEKLIGAISQPNDARLSLWQYLTPVHTPLITGAFYQFADPRDYPVIGFSNLLGDEAPYIETKTTSGIRSLEMYVVYTYGYGVVGKVGVVKTAAS